METLKTTRIALHEVLFATDFTPSSDAAFQNAVNVAKAFGARLNILHVVQPVIYAGGPATGYPGLPDAPWAIAQESMASLDSSLPEGVRHRTVIRDGFASSTVCSTVKEDAIDMVVMGTHGARGIEKAILGSVAEEVFRKVTCPVMTVGPNVTEHYAGKFDSVLFATDLSMQALRAAQYAFSWAEEAQAHITLLHVVTKNRGESEILEQQRTALHRLHSWIPEEATFWCDPHVEVTVGDQEREILDAADRHRANLIVISVHKAGALASHNPWALASQIVQKAKCPVLTIRDHYAD